MPLTQTKITKFFKPAKLPEWIKICRKQRKVKATAEPTAAKTPAKSKPTKPATTAPPKKDSSNNSPVKSKPQAKTQIRPSASLAPKPAKPDTSKQMKTEQSHTTPKNQPILDFLAKHTSPKFYFPKEARPNFRVLFPGTSVPKTTMLHGSPVIDKDLFNTLLASRIAAAHTVLRTAKLDRPRLPKSFVSTQIHLIQNSLRKPRKDKTSSPSPKTEKGKAPAKPIKKPTPPVLTERFVLAPKPAENQKSEQTVSLTIEQVTTAKLQSSDIQTPETEDLHSLISSIRDRRHLLTYLRLVEAFPEDLSPLRTFVLDCHRAANLKPFRLYPTIGQNSYQLDISSLEYINSQLSPNPKPVNSLEGKLLFQYILGKLSDLESIATRL